jgi:hypothetical protein
MTVVLDVAPATVVNKVTASIVGLEEDMARMAGLALGRMDWVQQWRTDLHTDSLRRADRYTTEMYWLDKGRHIAHLLRLPWRPAVFASLLEGKGEEELAQ